MREALFSFCFEMRYEMISFKFYNFFLPNKILFQKAKRWRKKSNKVSLNKLDKSCLSIPIF